MWGQHAPRDRRGGWHPLHRHAPARHHQLAGLRQARRGLAGLRVRHRWIEGTPHGGNHEGTLEWVDLDKLDTLPMWEGDRNFLPLVFDADPRPFHGVMPYKDGRMVSWSYSRL